MSGRRHVNTYKKKDYTYVSSRPVTETSRDYLQER